MKRFSAQYIFTNTGPPLKRAVLEAEDDGTIISITDTGGRLEERGSLEFSNGIIIPGFVNCHSHLELSHLKNKISRGTGLAGFIRQIREIRHTPEDEIISSAITADREMYKNGVVACADICNTDLTFNLKKESKIDYVSLIEVFGIDPDRAEKRMNEAVRVAEQASDLSLRYYIVPHSVYSVSLSLFEQLRRITSGNKITSLHFMESEDEMVFLGTHSGNIMDSYKASGLAPAVIQTARDHLSAVLDEITSSGNLILVHNTFVNKTDIPGLLQRKGLFWCLCPGSNIYIENRLPPAALLESEGCMVTIGTDSLASNSDLSIISELKTLQYHFPGLSLEEMIRWATINGAMALCIEDKYGKIEPGKRPGLLLLKDIDFATLKLLPSTTVTRLL